MQAFVLLCFFFCFVHFKNSLFVPGKVTIGVARPIPDDDEEYEESPPDTARYNGESLIKDAEQNKRGIFNHCSINAVCFPSCIQTVPHENTVQ